MSEFITQIGYSDILQLNKGSRWKTDKVIEYYLSKGKMEKSGNPQTIPGSVVYFCYHLIQKDLIYKSVDFEPPISIREWIAWSLLLVSIIANVLTAIFS